MPPDRPPRLQQGTWESASPARIASFSQRSGYLRPLELLHPQLFEPPPLCYVPFHRSGIWAGLSGVILHLHVALTGVTQSYSAGLAWKAQCDFTHIAAPQREQWKTEPSRASSPLHTVSELLHVFFLAQWLGC